MPALARDVVQKPAGKGKAFSLGLLSRWAVAHRRRGRANALPDTAADGPRHGAGPSAMRVLGRDAGAIEANVGGDLRLGAANDVGRTSDRD
eukprot:12880219-Alexandrium_andersonii.AAC.1